MSTIVASISPKLLDLKTSQIWYKALYGECQACTQIIFPKSGRGLGHVTYNIWHTIEHIFKTTRASDFKFGTRLCLTMLFDCRALHISLL